MSQERGFDFDSGVAVLWFTVVLVSSMLALVALQLFFDAWGDVCDQSHESPNTLGGWAILAAAVGASSAAAWLLRRRGAIPMPLVAVVITVQAAVLIFAVLPFGSC